jgi:hypothetical protein
MSTLHTVGVRVITDDAVSETEIRQRLNHMLKQMEASEDIEYVGVQKARDDVNDVIGILDVLDTVDSESLAAAEAAITLIEDR